MHAVVYCFGYPVELPDAMAKWVRETTLPMPMSRGKFLRRSPPLWIRRSTFTRSRLRIVTDAPFLPTCGLYLPIVPLLRVPWPGAPFIDM